MFDLTLTEEQAALHRTIREFADRRVRKELERGELTVTRAEPLLAELDAIGLLAPSDAEFGGGGRPDPVALHVALEELAAADPGLAFATANSLHAALIVASLGRREQAQALAEMLGGRGLPRLSLHLHEGFGRRPSEFETRATAPADGWTLHGRKIAVLWPGVAGCSVVLARDTYDGELAAFLLDGTAAVTVDRDDDVIGRLGLRAAHTGNVSYVGTRVPSDARLPGTGVQVARAVANARLALAAVALGTARAGLTYAARYATERQAFGRPIAEYQGVAFPLADVELNLHAVRLAAFDAIGAVGALAGIEEIERRTNRVVNRAGGLAAEATRVAVNTLGGHGFLEDHPCERWYRDAATLASIDCDPIDAPLLLA